MESMKARINGCLIGMGAGTMLITAVICLISLSQAYIRHIHGDMELMADLLYVRYENDGGLELTSEETGRMRVTLISPDGDVLYESDANAEDMDNHLERPEVQEALQGGNGEAHRESLTLSEDTYYYARLLEDGNILRVAMRTNSIFSMYGGVLISLFLIGVVVIIVSVGISMLLTKKLMGPMHQMAQHLDHIEGMPLYAELQPLSDALLDYQKKTHDLEKVRQEFTANVSHELKTPLTTISGYAEMMEAGMIQEKDISNCAGKIRKEAARMQKLIGDILELSKLDEPEMQRERKVLDLYQIAEHCIESAQLQAEQHQITLHLEGSSQKVLGEEGMLEELIGNLCDNGIRYNRPGGSVTVRVQEEPTGGVRLSVEDTGIGIPEEHQRRIFERFYRVDKGRSRESGGTGLGLAIVKHIVQQHGAQLQMKSAPDQGTCISVIFPAVSTAQGNQASKK